MTTSFYPLLKTHSIDAQCGLHQLVSPKKGYGAKIALHALQIFSKKDNSGQPQKTFKWNCVKLFSISLVAGAAAAFIDFKRPNTSIDVPLLNGPKLELLNIALKAIAFSSVFIAAGFYLFSKGKITDATPSVPQKEVTVTKNPIYGRRKRKIPRPPVKTPLTQALKKNQRTSKPTRRKKIPIPQSGLRTSNVNPLSKRKKYSNLMDEILRLEKNAQDGTNHYQWNQGLKTFESATHLLSFAEFFQELDRKTYPFNFKDGGWSLKIVDNLPIEHSKAHFKIRFKHPVFAAKFIMLVNHLLILDDRKTNKILYLIDLSKFGINAQEMMQKDHLRLNSEGKRLLIRLDEFIP